MKNILIGLCLLAFAINSYSQDSTIVEESFIVLYTLGENWDDTKQAYEQNYFGDHSSHLASLRKAGNILIGARYSKTGMLILRATGIDEAREMIASDIFIQQKMLQFEIYPVSPFYKGCIE